MISGMAFAIILSVLALFIVIICGLMKNKRITFENMFLAIMVVLMVGMACISCVLFKVITTHSSNITYETISTIDVISLTDSKDITIGKGKITESYYIQGELWDNVNLDNTEYYIINTKDTLMLYDEIKFKTTTGKPYIKNIKEYADYIPKDNFIFGRIIKNIDSRYHVEKDKIVEIYLPKDYKIIKYNINENRLKDKRYN